MGKRTGVLLNVVHLKNAGILNFSNLMYPLKSFNVGHGPLTHNAAPGRVEINVWSIDFV